MPEALQKALHVKQGKKEVVAILEIGSLSRGEAIVAITISWHRFGCRSSWSAPFNWSRRIAAEKDRTLLLYRQVSAQSNYHVTIRRLSLRVARHSRSLCSTPQPETRQNLAKRGYPALLFPILHHYLKVLHCYILSHTFSFSDLWSGAQWVLSWAIGDILHICKKDQPSDWVTSRDARTVVDALGTRITWVGSE